MSDEHVTSDPNPAPTPASTGIKPPPRSLTLPEGKDHPTNPAPELLWWQALANQAAQFFAVGLAAGVGYLLLKSGFGLQGTPLLAVVVLIGLMVLAATRTLEWPYRNPSTESKHRGAEKSAVAPEATALSWRMVLTNLGVQVILALFVGIVTMTVLLFLNTETAIARGSGVVAAVIALWMARSLVHWPIPKVALAEYHQTPPHIKPSESGGREVVETIVFVVVLVLLLKSFAAEAFVIPTGSMAETLYGYQKIVKCPSCEHEFPVNCSGEVDPQDGNPRVPINGCTCPSCRRVIRLVTGRPPRPGVLLDGSAEYVEMADPGWSSGDRVLVGKFLYDTSLPGVRHPERLDVVVFKFPEGPQKNGVAMNYIKRLIGLSGETIGISGGELFYLPPERGLKYNDEASAPLTDLWKKEYMHANDEEAQKFWVDGKFEIVRKSPRILLSMMRPVYDNDEQASDLKGPQWQRWQFPGQEWETKDNKSFRHAATSADAKEPSWLRYHHRLRDKGGKDTLINDFMGYNTGESLTFDPFQKQWHALPVRENTGVNWVGDLILECEVNVEKAEGELVLELVRSGERFRAAWDLSSPNGLCTLSRVFADNRTEKLATKETRLRKGTHRIRFANVDRQLTVWVDHTLPFESEPVRYSAPETKGPTALDLQPASIGVKNGTVAVQHIKLSRDSYHSLEPNSGDVAVSDWGDPKQWENLRSPPVKTLYVQPGHYLCLGDNSLASADSRSWGLVPQRLLLGRALLVYYPFDRAGRIR